MDKLVPVEQRAAQSAAPSLTDEQVDRFEAALSDLAPATKLLASWVCNQAKLAIRLVDAEPVAWMIELEDSQYPVDSLDDPQAIDDLTNSGATATPLIPAPTKGKS
jgi:hypothetical protein